MPGALKLTNLIPIYGHKPYKFLNLFSSAAAATNSTKSIIRRIHSSTLWCRTIRCAPPAQPRITFNIFNKQERQYLSGGIRGEKSCSFTSDAKNDRQDGRVDAPMGATVNGKIGNQCHDLDVSQLQNRRDNPPSRPSKLLTLPTILTIGRVAAVPLLVCTFYVESWWGPTTTTAIFLMAAITDWLDGFLARKMNLGTPFGAFLDPVADKLMVAATLILLCSRPHETGMFGQAQWLFTVPAIAIIGREITMSAVREWAASQDRKLLEAVAVDNLGKWKTATQMSALAVLLACRDGSLVAAGTLISSGIMLLYISAWLALWSLLVYVRKIWKVLLR